jgi:pterin-4a-carbinolamine dehydratase
MISATKPKKVRAKTKAPLIFINYRRLDTIATARSLLRFLQSHYGRHQVFMDTAEIRHGSNWSKIIEEALDASTVVIPLIGENWFKLTDEFGKRRIDQPDDWVQKELAFAFAERKIVLPIYAGIDPPPKKAFPSILSELTDIQSRVIRDIDSDKEWRELTTVLQKNGFGPPRSDVRYPKGSIKLRALSDSELRYVCQKIPGWRCVASPVPGEEHITRSELHKKYEFPSFKKAIEFMAQASIDINKKQHHPRWENIWRTVSVWLATWDVQFQVSQLDVDLAQHLDEIARKHKGIAIM